MAHTIYANPGDHRLVKAQLVALYAGIDLDLKDAKTAPEFKTCSPYGKVPVLVTPFVSIFEANAIARYLARVRADSGLYAQSFFDSALVDQWVDFSTSELEPACSIWILPVKGVLQFVGKAYSEARKDVEKALTILNDHLLHETFLVGDRITFADISIAVPLVEMYREVFDTAWRAKFPNVNRWFETLVNQPNFFEIFGKVEFAKNEKRAAVTKEKPEGKDEKQGQQGGQQGGQGKQQQQQQGQQKQQQQKQQQGKGEKAEGKGKPEKEEKEKEEGGEEQERPPPAGMILDAVKKDLFSVRPVNPDFFKNFWPKFEPQNYVLFEMLYNYNSENKVYFMTCNQLGGYLQRCDAYRKNALGVLTIIGNNDEDPPYEVQGAWVFKSSEPGLPKAVMEENPDSEYYTWRKLDASKPEDRARFEAHFFSDKLKATTGDTLNVLERRFFK